MCRQTEGSSRSENSLLHIRGNIPHNLLIFIGNRHSAIKGPVSPQATGPSRFEGMRWGASLIRFSARSLRDPRKRNRVEILQAKGGFPRERNTISELILRKSYDPPEVRSKSPRKPRQTRSEPSSSPARSRGMCIRRIDGHLLAVLVLRGALNTSFTPRLSLSAHSIRTGHTVSARSLRNPRKRNRAEILQAKGGFPRERNTISELILRKSY